jgi:preprotein translocase subunit SecE
MGINSKSMAMKKEKKSQSGNTKESVSGKKIFDFIGDIKTEFKKITWTEKEELKTYTKIVVGTTFLFGMMIYFIDLIIQGVLAGLNWFATIL